MPSPMPNAQMDSSQASLDPSNSASKLFVSSWRRSSVTRNSPAETSGLIHDRHVPTRMSGNEAVHPDHNPLPDPIRSVSDPIRCVPFRSGHPSLPLADNSPAQTFDSYTFLCSLMSSIRTSKSRWTAGKIEACRCTGRRRPAAGVARRVQRRQWSRRERAADAAT